VSLDRNVAEITIVSPNEVFYFLKNERSVLFDMAVTAVAPAKRRNKNKRKACCAPVGGDEETVEAFKLVRTPIPTGIPSPRVARRQLEHIASSAKKKTYSQLRTGV